MLADLELVFFIFFLIWGEKDKIEHMTTAKMLLKLVEVVLRALLKKIVEKWQIFKGKSVEKDSNKHINKQM